MQAPIKSARLTHKHGQHYSLYCFCVWDPLDTAAIKVEEETTDSAQKQFRVSEGVISLSQTTPEPASEIVGPNVELVSGVPLHPNLMGPALRICGGQCGNSL